MDVKYVNKDKSKITIHRIHCSFKKKMFPKIIFYSPAYFTDLDVTAAVSLLFQT